MASLQSVSQPSIDENIDVERSFELWINRALERNEDLAKKINFAYQIDVKLKSNATSTWILDLSSGTGSISQKPKEGIKCIVTIEESDLLKAILDKNHLRNVLIT